ncbi:MAG: hypothetical protein KY459_09015 [Acidobacteria bacterium]|nr:hypothetical protein [Acidobacteriota bacterium]
MKKIVCLVLICLPNLVLQAQDRPPEGPDGLATIVEADTLAGLINGLYGGDGIQLKEFFGHEAHFEGEGFIQFARTLQSTLQSRSLFPIPSSVGAISYSFNEQTGTYERVEGALGPVLAERGTTSGKGSLNITLGYSTAEFSELNGSEDIGIVLRHCLREACILNNDPNLPIYQDFIDVTMNINLRTEAVVASIVYGLTDDIDVGLVLPYLHNDLTVETNAVIIKQPDSIEGVHNFDIELETPRQYGRASATGIGDIIARSKFRLPGQRAFDMAALVDVKFPSGKEEDFLGSGDLTVKGTFAASKRGTRFIPHGNIGYELNTDDTSLSFFEYRLGSEVFINPRVTLALDLIGIIRPTIPEEFIVEELDLQLLDRSEIDGSLAAKFRVTDNAVAIVDLLVPLNDGGIRPDNSITFGLQWGL